MQNAPALNQLNIVKRFIFYKSKKYYYFRFYKLLYLGPISIHTQNVYIHYKVQSKIKIYSFV